MVPPGSPSLGSRNGRRGLRLHQPLQGMASLAEVPEHSQEQVLKADGVSGPWSGRGRLSESSALRYALGIMIKLLHPVHKSALAPASPSTPLCHRSAVLRGRLSWVEDFKHCESREIICCGLVLVPMGLRDQVVPGEGSWAPLGVLT